MAEHAHLSVHANQCQSNGPDRCAHQLVRVVAEDPSLVEQRERLEHIGVEQVQQMLLIALTEP